MQITYQLNDEDIPAIAHQLGRKSKNVVIAIALFFVFFLSINIYLSICTRLYVGPLEFADFLKRWQRIWQFSGFRDSVYRDVYFLVGLVVFYILLYFFTQFLLTRELKKNPIFHSPSMVRLEPEHLFVENYFGELKLRWAALREIRSDAHTFYFFTMPQAAQIVPRRAFATPAEADAFLQQADRYYDAAKHPPAEGTPI